MQTEVVNPWAWQDRAGFSQAVVVSGEGRVVHCAGQTSVDENGTPLHEGDMPGQVAQALDNLETVLGQAGMSLADVVRLTYFTTDVDAFLATMPTLVERLDRAGRRPASSLLGVSRLARPQLMVEIEATAAA
jgi:enamine deaminase RidA (YjgF/YER057c/UK114 family)